MAQDAAPASSSGLAPLLGLELESLSATRTLPLFTPSRSAPAPEPEAPEYVPPEPAIVYEAAPAAPSLQLLGIVAVQADQVAVLSDPLQGTVQRLRSGEEYNGWTVRIVDGRTVELSSGESRHTLTLFQDFGVAPPPLDPLAEGEAAPGEPLVVQEPEL